MQLFKFPTKVSIFYNKNLNNNLYLCIDYKDLNNHIIKSQHFLPLIRKSLNYLGHAKRFI